MNHVFELIAIKHILNDNQIKECQISHNHIRYSMFNKQIHHILNHGKHNIILPQIYIDQWYVMFLAIKPMIDAWCKETNRRSISYSYFIHRICQMLDHYAYISYFPMFNNNQRQFDYDQIWIQIKKKFK